MGFIALAAVAAAAGILIFGDELNNFARRLIYLVSIARTLLEASQIVGVFGVLVHRPAMSHLTFAGTGEGTDG